MNIKIREQAGTDAVRKFDYQMAVALDHLLTEIDGDVIVLIETLEDFAVFHNFGSELEKIDVYQVKTKDRGLYDKTSLYSDNVLGKIILTDFYFDAKANSLNIVCNTSLKGKSTEALDCFAFIETLTENEAEKLKTNVVDYLDNQPDFSGDVNDYWGKLIYMKSSLPFSNKDERYIESLIGKTNSTIAHYLEDENHTINPQVVFNTLKLFVDRQRRNRINSSEISVEEAIVQKGISTNQVKEVIDKVAETTYLTKNEIFQHAATIFAPQDYLKIKQEYAMFLSYRANLMDRAFLDAKDVIAEEYQRLTVSTEFDALDDIVRQVSYNCMVKIPYYSLPVIQILTIVVVYS